MFTPTAVIQKKRDGKTLTREEIYSLIQGIGTGSVTDYQATAWMMAVYFQGMSLEEIVSLTEVMLNSGERYDLSRVTGTKVDKHSTGGVGDKVSLILAPLAAACGLKVPMMSGRGLGFSGGTLDKLESIPGFDVHLSKDRFEEILNEVGCAMIGQSEKIVPADRQLYTLRDVTATVESIPLIVASILSKKLAEGTQALVLDVKVGSGAFMKTKETAKKLAKTIIQVSKRMGLPCRTVLTNMNQPLGYAVGNALEVKEAMEVLSNSKKGDLSSCDLRELTIQLCAHMLDIGGVASNLTEGRKLAHSKLLDGSAWNIFQKLIQAQKGKLDPLPYTSKKVVWKAQKRGYLTQMNTEAIGQILVEMGGGRKKATDSIDPRVGLIFHKKLGTHVQLGDTLATAFVPDQCNLNELEERFHQSIEISKARKPVPKLIFEVIE